MDRITWCAVLVSLVVSIVTVYYGVSKIIGGGEA